MWVHPKVQFFLTMDHFDQPFTKKKNHEAFNNTQIESFSTQYATMVELPFYHLLKLVSH